MGADLLQGITDSMKSITGPLNLAAPARTPLKSFPMDPELIQRREKARYEEHLSVFNSIPAPWEEVRERGEKIWFYKLNMEGRCVRFYTACSPYTF